MASTRTLQVVIAGDASQARAAFAATETGATGFGAKMDALSDKMRTVGRNMTLGVTLPIVGGLALATKAAVEEEASIESLSQALHRNWSFTKQQTAAVEDQITKWQNSTGIMDDKLRPALANLARAGMDWTQSQRTMNTVMDIAQAKHLDVETVAKAVAKAYDGNVGALSRLGIATKDASGATLTFDQIMKNAADTMGGAAAKHAETAAGKMEILRAKFEDTKEQIGSALIPILTQVGDVLASVASAFSSLSPGQQELIVWAGLAVAAIGPLLTVVGNLKGAFNLVSGAITSMTNVAWNPYLAALALAAVAIVAVTLAFKTQGEQIDVNIGKFRELNNEQLVRYVQNIQLIGQATGNSNLVHEAFNRVLAEDTTQAQRFIEALGAAGQNTDWYTKKLETHVQQQVTTQRETDASKAKVDALTESYKRVPASVYTHVGVNTDDAQWTMQQLLNKMYELRDTPWVVSVGVTADATNPFAIRP